MQFGCVLRSQHCPGGVEIQERSEYYRCRTQRGIIVGEGGKVRNVARRGRRTRTKLSKRIGRDVVNKAHIKRRVCAVRLWICGQGLEGDKPAIAAQPSPNADNPSRANYMTVRIQTILRPGHLAQPA